MIVQQLSPAFSRRTSSVRQAFYSLLLLVILMMLGIVANAAPRTLGPDIPYAVLKDVSGTLSLIEAWEELACLEAKHKEGFARGYVRDTYWLRFQLPTSAFGQQDRWLELGPNFLDDLQLFYRPTGTDEPWQSRQTGDLLYGKSDLDYRNPVFILSSPAANTAGYDVIVRIQSSSSIILQASLWEPAQFLGHAARSASFWSFYFGLAAISSLLALILAIVMRSRLLWAVTIFSSTYLFVASINGYVNWIFMGLGVPIQHYLTSVLTITSFALLMWLSSETINLRQHLPWAQKLLLTGCGLTLSLLILIPLDQYGTAVKITAVIFMVTAALFIYATWLVWAQDRFRLSTLLLGSSPLICIIASLFGLFSIFGWIPFRPELYVVWQYALVVNMLLVMAIAVYRIREKKLEELEKQQLATELKLEREASFYQRQFMGMVAHEFRTPLAVISASLTNLVQLENGVQSPRTIRYEKIHRATERLVQLTDNCLADARLAAEYLHLDLQLADLPKLVESAASLVKLFDSHQLVLTVLGRPVDTSDSHISQVLVDTALLRIALSNVIDNAVKYSTGGLIHIDCGVDSEWTIVRITDQGTGIDEHQAKHVFEPYRRGTDAKQGVGLGLYVARQIAHAHGGELLLLASSAQGSCFEFRLSSKREAQAPR